MGDMHPTEQEKQRLLALSDGAPWERVDAILDELHDRGAEWDDARTALSALVEDERAEVERLRAEVEQWRATFGESALRDGLARMTRAEAENGRLRSQLARHLTAWRNARSRARLFRAGQGVLRADVAHERDRANKAASDLEQSRWAAKELEKHCNGYKADLAAQAQRVRDLHPREDHPRAVVCGTCVDADEEPAAWPCPTIAALDDTEPGA